MAVVDALAEKYIHAPYDRGQERVVAMIAVDHHRIVVQRDWSTQEYSGSACCRRDSAKG